MFLLRYFSSMDKIRLEQKCLSIEDLLCDTQNRQKYNFTI